MARYGIPENSRPTVGGKKQKTMVPKPKQKAPARPTVKRRPKI